ncbi:hypothetical protein PSTG_11838 [Puccinia striiformis f. sp. tritici PST-78]|uniref:Uncharacterized protein n=1 Tax=Puccinia striiformis f. sp. tritici PST-78 TaxID=1165861 RepID=A0A0L0V6B9_9BASI|nr:hypothetical protein PSTG_11838 [Puccinia striiformis f. sp. tritici PST-78]
MTIMIQFLATLMVIFVVLNVNVNQVKGDYIFDCSDQPGQVPGCVTLFDNDPNWVAIGPVSPPPDPQKDPSKSFCAEKDGTPTCCKPGCLPVLSREQYNITCKFDYSKLPPRKP